MKKRAFISTAPWVKLCLSLAFIIQALLPSYAATYGANASINVSSYLCNQMQASAPDEAEAALREILIASGKLDPVSSDHAAHCDYCVISGFALSAPLATPLEQAVYISPPSQVAYTKQAFHYYPQGPPIGGRAPPH